MLVRVRLNSYFTPFRPRSGGGGVLAYVCASSCSIRTYSRKNLLRGREAGISSGSFPEDAGSTPACATIAMAWWWNLVDTNDLKSFYWGFKSLPGHDFFSTSRRAPRAVFGSRAPCKPWRAVGERCSLGAEMECSDSSAGRAKD